MDEERIARKEQIERRSEREQVLKLDNRGRVTIPSNVRSRYEIDPTDDRTIWVELEIDSIEIEEESNGGES